MTGDSGSKHRRRDVSRIEGFSDAVFDTMARFAQGETRDWVEIVEATEV